MKRDEQDELRAREVRALEQVADELQRARAEREASRPPAGRLPQPLGVPAFLRSIPGFAGLWEHEVPRAYWQAAERDGYRVAIIGCMCGESVEVAVGGLADCGCGRWFLHAGRTIRVKRFEGPAAAAA